MITTIQLNDQTKNSLSKIKQQGETYEALIIRMMQLLEQKKREQEELMIEGCKEMAKDMLKINKEWEGVDSDIDWEWDENGN